MANLNRVQLIGRLGKDPETKFTPSGKKVCKFSIATSQKWKDANGDEKESTEWHNLEAWGRVGEICQQYLKKGSLVYIEGRLKTDKYEDQQSGTKYFTKVVVGMLQMLGDKKSGGAQGEDPGNASEGGAGGDGVELEEEDF